MQLLLPFSFTRKAAGVPGRVVVSCAHEAYEVVVQRHPRARRYTLRVREASRDVVMTIPPRGSLRQARAFAEKNAAWIANRLQRMPAPVPFADGEVIPLRGIPHRIVRRPGGRGRVWTEEASDGAALLCVAGAPQHLARRIADFLKREARRDLSAASRRYAAMLEVEIDRLGLRDTQSRWGSCSEAGTLSYSWRLVLAPPHVLDYLAAHEVAHRRELNHSARFWRIVARMTPDWRRAEAWLKAHGPALHRYGARG